MSERDEDLARAFIREHMYHWFEPDKAGKHDAEKIAYDALIAALRAAREEERGRCAEIAREFSWTLPVYNDRRLNEVSDDAACEVQLQIARAIEG